MTRHALRHDWTKAEIAELFDLPFMELVFRAAAIHRQTFDPSEVQLSQLLSVKTGGCAENCGYCSQSAHFDTGLKASKLMPVDEVLAAATAAKAGGAQRFCMGAAWRELKDRDVPALSDMIAGVKALGMETCVTLGMLRPDQADRLKTAGLDYYNHNLDTSPEYYGQVVTTRTYQERLDTLAGRPRRRHEDVLRRDYGPRRKPGGPGVVPAPVGDPAPPSGFAADQ